MACVERTFVFICLVTIEDVRSVSVEMDFVERISSERELPKS
jgi:hypothetical protein